MSAPVGCPYCGTIINPPPARSRKCPHCRERIVVRTRRSDGVKLLLTEAAGKEFDKQRKAEVARNEGIRRSQNIGASIEDFERTEKELTGKWGFAPPRDVFWALANEAVLDAAKKGTAHHLSMVYWEMARLLYDEGNPRHPHIEMARRASRASIQAYAERGIGGGKVEVLATCCQVCDVDNGREYTIAQAIEVLPIPHEACENNGWCRCTWLPGQAAE